MLRGDTSPQREIGFTNCLAFVRAQEEEVATKKAGKKKAKILTNSKRATAGQYNSSELLGVSYTRGVQCHKFISMALHQVLIEILGKERKLERVPGSGTCVQMESCCHCRTATKPYPIASLSFR